MQRPAHEMIERYLYQVAKRLPQDLRDDVTQELRSLILDSLEDRSGDASYDDDAVVEVLRQMGPPEQMAARYQAAGPSLIGPHLYPAFLRVAKYTVMGLFAALGTLVAVSMAGTSMAGTSIWNAGWAAEWAWLLSASLGLSLGILVLVFAIAERALARKARPATSGGLPAFDPRGLPTAPAQEDPDRMSPGMLVTRIYVVAAFFTMLNFFPRWFGPFFASRIERNGEILYTAGAVPLPVLGIHVPLAIFDTWCLLAMVLTVAVLRQGRWTSVTRWSDIALRGLAAVVLAITLGAGIYGSADLAWIQSKYPEFQNAAPPLRVLLLQTVLWTLVATVIGTAVRTYREVRRGSTDFHAVERHC
jgi:hypothetical protein